MEWMEEGRKALEAGMQEAKEEVNKTKEEGFGFNFLGKKGREDKEYTLRAIHNYKCKWEGQTMHLLPVDMNVPSEQKYRAMRTQIKQQVERLGCRCYIAFEERKMRQWIEGQGNVKQEWVTVIDNEDTGPSDETVFSIFFAKHDGDCKWKGKGEMKLNPFTTRKEGGELKREVAKITNRETEAQGCECGIDFGSMADLETKVKMNQGKVHVLVYEEPEEEGLEESQWADVGGTLQLQAMPDGHDTQSEALPRSKSFTGAKKAGKGQAQQTQQPPPPFQTPPDNTGLDAAMQYVIKTMTGVAARSDQMYRGYLDRVAEKDQMMEQLRRAVRKGIEELRRELREEMRTTSKQEWSGKRKQVPLPPKPEQTPRKEDKEP